MGGGEEKRGTGGEDLRGPCGFSHGDSQVSSSAFRFYLSRFSSEMSVSLSLCPSLSCVCTYVSLCISLFLSISVDFFISLSVILFLYTMCMRVCVSVFSVLSLCLYISASTSRCVFLCLVVSTSLCLSVFYSVSLSLFTSLPLSLFVSISVFLNFTSCPSPSQHHPAHVG